MVRWLGVSETDAVRNCRDEYGAYISYKALKDLYKSTSLLLQDWRTRTDEGGRRGERERCRLCCVRSFLLYMIGCTFFGDKSNKHVVDIPGDDGGAWLDESILVGRDDIDIPLPLFI